MIDVLALGAWLSLLILLFLTITVAVLERWDQEALMWAKSLFLDEPKGVMRSESESTDAMHLRRIWRPSLSGASVSEPRGVDGDTPGSVRSARVTTGVLFNPLSRARAEVLSAAEVSDSRRSCTLAKTRPATTDGTALTAEVPLAGSNPAEAQPLWTAADDAALDATIREFLGDYDPRHFTHERMH